MGQPLCNAPHPPITINKGGRNIPLARFAREIPIPSEKVSNMPIINAYTRFGMVEVPGDQEVPWWIAPYVRDFVGLAKSSAVSEAQRGAAETDPGLASLTQRLAQTAAVAHVAANVKGNEGFAAGVSATMAADIDEYCGTPPRPKHVNQAGLAVSLIAASLAANDPAKAALVSQAERLQKLRGQTLAAA
jgi:hypothetical protein